MMIRNQIIDEGKLSQKCDEIIDLTCHLLTSIYK